jgi:DNA-binding beta-propeller fold protein YncE
MKRDALLTAVILLGMPAAAAAQPTSLATYVAFAEQRVVLGGSGAVLTGNVGSNGVVYIGRGSQLPAAVDVAADVVSIRPGASVLGDVYFNRLVTLNAAVGPLHQGLSLPILTLPASPPVDPNFGRDRVIDRLEMAFLPAGRWGEVRVANGATLVFLGGEYDIDELIVRGGQRATTVRCQGPEACVIRVLGRLLLRASAVGLSGTDLTFQYAGTRSVTLGERGSQIRAALQAPAATLRLRSSRSAVSSFTGRFTARRLRIGSGATLDFVAPSGGTVCGNGVAEPPAEDCDGADDSACPGSCDAECNCPPPAGTQAVLHSIGPSVLHNATDFGVQLFGEDFIAGATFELADKTSGTPLASLPTTFITQSEMTARVPAGMAVPAGIERELVARVVNPGAPASAPPDIGHCQTDRPNSPIACTSDADCPPGAGTCVQGIQRLTMFNDLAFLNPNSVAVVPAPYGLCDDGSPCDEAADCAGIGSGSCSPKLYVTPQQLDELWVYNTGTDAFADLDGGQAGIQGIAVGDNPFHVEILDRGGGVSRAWVVNRFDDAISIVDPATDTELARVTGTALGAPGRLRMETEIEFNRAGTRAYLSNENLDEVQVLDIAGANLDAPVLVGAIDVGVNPRGMATNAADTRLYVANVQSADVSVVDIAPGSGTENQVIGTIAPRATDDIVGGRAEGWESFVISGRAPRGVVYSDAHDAVFVTSIGPQTGPRQGVVLTGGAIINPTITVIDAATDTIVAHVALDIVDPDRASCTDPELMALDDARGRLYVTCQGSGTVDVLDTAALVAGLPAEAAIVSLPLPTDVTVPTLALPPATGAFGQKVCAAFTSVPGTACSSNGDCAGCPALVEGLPVTCCARNNPVGLHNGPRGVAISADRNTLYVVNQFTTSVASLDVSPADPASITVSATTSFPGAFGSNTTQRDRRLGQIEFFTDVKKTGISCATCHIDDHQDGLFFEADVRGPRLRRVLSLRGTRDFPPLLQDQLVPDLLSFTDLVVHAERGGFLPCIPCIEIGGTPFCTGTPTSECRLTSNSENLQNAVYAKAITFFPNPNLNPDGSFSTAVPLPGSVTGDAVRGATVFDQIGCQNCHPEPLFTIDQLRGFDIGTLGQPVRMREVGTPVFIPLRANCQDVQRPSGFDGSSGFTVPTLRGVWDTFPLLLSGAAGLGVVGPEPSFTFCTPGSAGCCSQLESPLNPAGTTVPEQHLAVTTKDALRAALTAPLALPGTGHGAALGLSPADLNALIAYIRSL